MRVFANAHQLRSLTDRQVLVELRDVAAPQTDWAALCSATIRNAREVSDVCASQDGQARLVPIGVSASESTMLIRLVAGGQLWKRVVRGRK